MGTPSQESTGEWGTSGFSPQPQSLPSLTGGLSKPSLQTHQSGNVTTGEKVTLQCRLPDIFQGSVKFALLKAGTSMPVQTRSPKWKETDFSLQNVTVNDTGNYSCVYYRTEDPFQASDPSDHLAIWVTGEVSTIGRTIAGLYAS